jgi:hypothetical protein
MRSPGRRRTDERGALTPAVIIIALGLLLLGGMVTDGGRQLNAKLRAQATAEEAARAGANMVDLEKPALPIDWQEAQEAIAGFCDQAMAADATITECEPADYGYVGGERAQGWVETRVVVEVSPLLFGIIGVDSLRADVTARAYAQEGIFTANDGILDVDYTPTVRYPTTTLTVPENTDPSSTVISIPSDYTTVLCGETTTLPRTVGVSCSQTVVTLPPPPPPPPPTATETRTSYTTFPTSVPPFPEETR